MANKKKQSETKSSKPAFYAYHVANHDEQEKSFWTKLGAAFPHKDGKGFSLIIETLPRDGRITLRVPLEKLA